MLYIALLTVLASTYGVPLPAQLSPGQLFYYPQPQYVKSGLHPYLQYLTPIPKSIQSGHTQNELIYYPTVPAAAAPQFIINPQPTPEVTPAATTRFTAPPQGLVNAIFSWFSENNIPIPDGPSKSEILSQIKEKPDSAKPSEAEVLVEAEKPQDIQKTQKSGQRFYILNGQPEYIGLQTTYTQPYSPFVPKFLMKSAFPDDQNMIFYQPQGELQQANLKLRNSGIGVQNQEVYSPQNVLLVKNLQEQNIQDVENVRPVRYHGGEFGKKQQNQQVQNYGQPVFVERLLAQNQVRQPIQTVYQTQYVPIGVVPPQENNLQHIPLQYHLPTQEIPKELPPHLNFIQIPVNKDVQIPHYIKTVVPITIDAKTKIPEENRSEETPKVVLKDGLQSRFAQSEIQGEKKEDKDPSAELATLDFVRYIASRQNDQFSDTVVIDAKTDDQKEDTQSEEVQISADEPSEPTIAQAQPAGIALAGPGGIAATAPRGTALAGEKGLAISSPRATAVAGPNTEKQTKPTHKKH